MKCFEAVLTSSHYVQSCNNTKCGAVLSTSQSLNTVFQARSEDAVCVVELKGANFVRNRSK